MERVLFPINNTNNPSLLLMFPFKTFHNSPFDNFKDSENKQLIGGHLQMLQNLYQIIVKFKWLCVLVVVHVKLNFYDSFFLLSPIR